jgi:hypothetical protein
MSHSFTTFCAAPTYIYDSEPNTEGAISPASFSISIPDAIDADTSTTATIGFCSRDPIGYHDGHHLYRNYFETWGTDPSGTSCSVADCVDRCRSLPVSSTGGNRSPMRTHPRQECIDRCNDAAQRFYDWFDTQVRNGYPNFSALPPCPCDMTKCTKIACAGVGDPGHSYETFCAPTG